MKMPMPPPNLDEIMQRLVASNRLMRVLSYGTANPIQDEYLSWDKLRFKNPPNDLAHDEWWAALKVARRMTWRTIKLKDRQYHPFSYCLPDEVLRLTDEISRRSSGEIAMSEQVTNSSTRDRYIVNSLIEEAITSSQLEGAATSRQVAKEMIRSGRPPRDKSEQMILNNYHAMQFIREVRDVDLSPELICEVHRIVTEKTLDDPTAAGRIQSSPDPNDRVAVFGDDDQIIHHPPPVEELPKRLRNLCDFANAKVDESWIHPVLRALTIHFMMGYDHYFEDGNGRTARALFYWSMLRQGHWLVEFLTISKILKRAPAQYARSFVLTEQDEGDLTYFFIHHLRVIRKAIIELNEYLSRKVSEIQETKSLLASSPGEYNHRQIAVLELAMRDSSASFTAQSHATSHNVSSETARHDLQELEARGLLTRIKRGKKFYWLPIQNLHARIKGDNNGPIYSTHQ
jgi:Fic family protein